MMYPHKQIVKLQKTVSKPVNVGNLINARLAEKHKSKQFAENPFIKAVKMAIQSSVVEVHINCYQKGNRPLRQYVEVLQHSESILKHKVEQLTRTSQDFKAKQDLNSLNKQTYLYKLEEYYSKSRRLMLENCLEMVDCKALLMSCSDSFKYKNRVDSISKMLTRVEAFLKSCIIGVQPQGASQHRDNTCVKQLQQTVHIQDKTINHLREILHHPEHQTLESQKRLLRYEINRVFNQNQRLKQQCGLTYSQFLTRLRVRDSQNQNLLLNQVIREYFQLMDTQTESKDVEYRHRVEKTFIQDKLEETKVIVHNLQNEILFLKEQTQSLAKSEKSLTEENLNLSQQVQKLRQDILTQRKRLSQQCEYSKIRGEEIAMLRSEINQNRPRMDSDLDNSMHQKSVRETELQQEMTGLRQKLLVTEVLLEESNCRLKVLDQNPAQEERSQEPGSPIKKSDYQDLSGTLKQTLQERVDYLQQYLRQNTQNMYLVWREFRRKTQVESRQQLELIENLGKEKHTLMLWCKKIYLLLKRSDIPEDIIQNHLAQLQEMQSGRKSKSSKLDVQLETVKQCSVLLDKHQIREMEEELEEYIQTLKKRGDIIKEVDNQDGSSVATVADFRSEAFTDLEQRLSENDDSRYMSNVRQSRLSLLESRHQQSRNSLEEGV